MRSAPPQYIERKKDLFWAIDFVETNFNKTSKGRIKNVNTKGTAAVNDQPDVSGSNCDACLERIGGDYQRFLCLE
jgi:hypothetical protein